MAKKINRFVGDATGISFTGKTSDLTPKERAMRQAALNELNLSAAQHRAANNRRANKTRRRGESR